MIQGGRRGSWGTTSDARVRSTSDLRRAVTYVVYGELAFLFFTAVSVALHPGFVLKWDEGGMSNYGLHIKTAVPYTLALVLLSVYSRRAALLYADGDGRSRRLSVMLSIYSAVVLSVMVSTYFYSLNNTLKDIHFTFGTLLVVVVGVSSLWMYQLWPPTISVRLLLVVQLCGDVMALLTVVSGLHILFAAEMLSNVGFASLVVRTGRRVAAEDDETDSLCPMTT